MKPAPFQYHAPATLEEALHVLREVAEEDAHVLAGGQSLVPMMALRLALPDHLIDINRIDELNTIEERDDRLIIGALKRHADFARPVTNNPLGGLLSTVQHHIAHYPIRLRGTLCGSLAHADPASEWCLLAATLDAVMNVRSDSGKRSIAAADFFLGIMTTALAPDEMLAGVSLPLLAPNTRFGFYEFSRRAGDFAMAAALATLRIEKELVVDARIGVGGAAERPHRLLEAEAALQGQSAGEAAIWRAADAAADEVDPIEDPQIPSGYRRDLVRAAVTRALAQAMTTTTEARQ